MSQIKETLFGNYGTDDDLNIFNFGFSTDKSGYLSLNSSTFDTALSDNYDDIKNLFVGLAEDEGLGTQLKTYVDALDGFDGLITAYEDNMTDREEALEAEKEKAVEALDTRYAAMAQQFADYGVIINQMEASFSGLKLLIDQSTS
jgi:flagellar hook-associated protein 2